MTRFSNEQPPSPDYGTEDWNSKYADLQKVIADKLGRSAEEQKDTDQATAEESR